MPGTFQAVYDGSKAFLDSFSAAVATEFKGSGVSVTCLMPAKANAAEVAKIGFDAMMRNPTVPCGALLYGNDSAPLKVSREISRATQSPGKESCQSKIRTIHSPINFLRMNPRAMSRSPQ
jgi:short-subunit dehydrogenase